MGQIWEVSRIVERRRAGEISEGLRQVAALLRLIGIRVGMGYAGWQGVGVSSWGIAGFRIPPV